MAGATTLELVTPRLMLRPIRESDFDAIHAYASDPEITRYMIWGPNTEQQTRDFIALARAACEASPRTVWEFAIMHRGTEELIGTGGYHVERSNRSEASLGYCLRREAWGRGYMTEAAHAMFEHAFRSVGVHRVFATCHPENRASAHVMEKLGMRYEGRLREVVNVRGEWWDLLLYAVLEHEFR